MGWREIRDQDVQEGIEEGRVERGEGRVVNDE